MKLDLLTKEEVQEAIREELQAWAEALLAKLRQKPVLRGRRAAAAYVGMSLQEFKEAERKGYFRALPWTLQNSPLYDAEELERDMRLFAEMGRNGGNPESKAAAGGEAPAREE